MPLMFYATPQKLPGRANAVFSPVPQVAEVVSAALTTSVSHHCAAQDAPELARHHLYTRCATDYRQWPLCHAQYTQYYDKAVEAGSPRLCLSMRYVYGKIK